LVVKVACTAERRSLPTVGQRRSQFHCPFRTASNHGRIPSLNSGPFNSSNSSILNGDLRPQLKMMQSCRSQKWWLAVATWSFALKPTSSKWP